MPRLNRVRPLRAAVAALIGLLAMSATSSLGASAAPPTESELDAAESRLTSLKSDLEALTARFGEVHDRLESLNEETARTELTVRRLAREMIEQRAEALELAQEIYKGGTAGGVEALLSSRTLAEMDAQLAYLESSEEARSEVFEGLAAKRSEYEDKLDEWDAARAEAAEAYDELAGLRAEVESDIGAQQSEIEEIEDAIAAAEAREAAEAAAAAAAAEAAAEAAEEAASTPPPTSTTPNPSPPAGGYRADWDAIAQCESGGRWHIDSTYDGGLQFHPDTWLAYGGGRYARYAWQATREQQIAIAEKVLAGQGPGAWPNCFQWA